MDYKEYYEIYYNYRQAKTDLHKLENKIADVISCLISTTSRMKDDGSNKGNNTNDKMLQLTARKIELESQEDLQIELLRTREKQKYDAEMELRKSNDLKDIVYVKYYIDHIRPKEISKTLNFARSYIYNLLGDIRIFIYEYDKKHKKK